MEITITVTHKLIWAKALKQVRLPFKRNKHDEAKHLGVPKNGGGGFGSSKKKGEFNAVAGRKKKLQKKNSEFGPKFESVWKQGTILYWWPVEWAYPLGG